MSTRMSTLEIFKSPDSFLKTHCEGSRQKPMPPPPVYIPEALQVLEDLVWKVVGWEFWNYLAYRSYKTLP